MAPRSSIIAGKTVIVVQVQESIDRALSQISGKLHKFSASISRIGLDLFAGGLLGTLVTTRITSQFKEFEDRILFLSTKLRTTEKEFAAVVETIRELGRTTSFTAIQVADGATVLAQAGLNAREVINTLQPTLDLARGAQIELEAAGAILTNTIRSFGLETSKANEVASQFIAAARLGTLNVLDLKESIKEVLGTVRSLNIDLPTTLALITQLAERSLRGTKAGTSLNTALLNLASKQKQLKQLGITLPNNLDSQSFLVFLEQLYDRINQLGNIQRTAVLQKLFNIRGGRAITGLDDIEKIIRLQKEIRNAGDEARRAAKVMDSGLGGSIRIAISAVESLSISLGKLVGNVLKPFLDIVAPLTNALEQIARINPVLTTSILLAPPALLALGAGLLATGYIGSKLAGILGGLAKQFHFLSDLAISGLNKQLVAANTLITAFTKRVARTGKGSSRTRRGGIFQSLDEGLSSLLLRPQRIAAGRAAGQIRPTSFFGRVGNARIITGVGAATRKVLGLFDLLTPATYKLQFAAVKLFTGMLKVQKVLFKLGPVTSNLVRLFTSLSAVLSHLVFPSFNIHTGADLLRGVKTVISSVRILRSHVINFAKTAITSFRAATKGLTAYRVAILATAKVGDVLRKLTPDFSKIAAGNNTTKFLVSLGNYLKNLRGSLARGNLAAVFNPKPLATLIALLRKTAIGKVLGGFINLIGSGTRGLIGGLRALTKIDFVSTLYKGIRIVGTLAKGFFTLLNVVRRFVFSFGGILTIAELLIIFGPKIEFIRKAFERLGEGVGRAFDTIKGTFKDLAPVFDLFRKSFGQIFKGEGEVGIKGLITGVKLLATIVKSNLVVAFNQIKEAVAPLYDFIRTTVISIIESVKLIGSLLGATFSNIGTGINELTGGGAGSLAGTLKDTITEAFSPEAIKAGFAFVGGFFVSIAQNINRLLRDIFVVVSNTMAAIETALFHVFNLIQNLSFNLIAAVAGNPLLQTLIKPLTELGLAAQGAAVELGSAANTNKDAVDGIITGFDTGIDKMDTLLTGFLDRLEGIFKKDTEADAKASQDAARTAKEKAQEEAKRQAAAVATGTTLFTKLGGVIGKAITDVRSFFPSKQVIPPEPFNFSSFLKFGKQALQKGAAGISPTALARAEIEQLKLDERAAKANKRRSDELRKSQLVDVFSRGGGISNILKGIVDLDKDIAAGKAGFAESAAERKKRIADLRAQLANPTATNTLRDIVSATVGSFAQTRANLLKVAGGQSIDQQQLETLNSINENTGGTNTSLGELLKKSTPFVFQ